MPLQPYLAVPLFWKLKHSFEMKFSSARKEASQQVAQADKVLQGSSSPVKQDLKQDDAFNTTWWPALSIDKCCQVTNLSIERIDN